MVSLRSRYGYGKRESRTRGSGHVIASTASQIATPAGVLRDGALVLSGAGRNFLYLPDQRRWLTVTTSPIGPGLGGHTPIVLASGLVLSIVRDQWAVLDPNATTSIIKSSSGMGLDSPTLSLWLTLAVIALGLLVSLEFGVTRLRGRRERRAFLGARER